MKSFLQICALFFSLTAVAQKKPAPNVDSLKYELYKATNDTLRIKLLETLVYKVIYTDGYIALGYGKEMLAISEKWGDSRKMGYAYYCIGLANMSLGNFKEVKQDFSKSIGFFKFTGDKEGEAGANCNIGLTLSKSKQYSQALPYLYRARKLLTDSNINSSFLANTNMVLGNARICLHQYDSTEYYLFSAAKEFEANGNKDNLSKCYYYFGNLYGKLKRYQEMEDYEQKALNLAKELDQTQAITLCTQKLKYAHKRNRK